MKILALITARKGSKRIPRKNVRLLGGKPLVKWTIDLSQSIDDINETLVSTDDEKVFEVSEKSGCLVPWLRPPELSSDEAKSVDVALHAVDWYEQNREKVDGLLLLQPTTPFRTKSAVQEGINLFQKSSGKTVLGVSKTHDHPMWTFKKDGEYLSHYFEGRGLEVRSQCLPEALVVNGSFYLISPHLLREHRSFFGPNTLPLIIDSSQEALDIDTEWDFKLAEVIASELQK
jgi:N-acylneuraminate cytidylyltransferase